MAHPSLFVDEGDEVFRRTMMPSQYQPRQKFGGFQKLPRATYSVTDKRKRSRMEALARLYAIRPKVENLPFGIQRAIRRPLVIYEASLWLAAGLVITDPLDRLDGVI